MSEPDLEHPRPSMRRPWVSFDGSWRFALAPADADPNTLDFDGEITVPFAPETSASGVGPLRRVGCCWYRRHVDASEIPGTGRPVLHFAGVDRTAHVWVDGHLVGEHVGGYSAFAVPLPEHDDVEITVRALDPPDDLSAPRGKQDWDDEPHGIWYPRTTGIWKPVWAERVPDASIDQLQWIADVSTMGLTFRVELDGTRPGDQIRLRLHADGRTLVDHLHMAVDGRHVDGVVRVGDGGFDDRHGLLWWPSRPTMIEADVELRRDGDVLDGVLSATAMRSVGVRNGRFHLNGRPWQLRMVLDQGYWPESGATPPSTDALRHDIEITKALGFNAVRKHQKTEDLRYFALADRLGLMAWVEMPSAHRSGPATSAALVREWCDVIEAHRNHPSVVGWVPVNESWGAEGCEGDHAQRALIAAMREMAGALDGTRPVSANDGWETLGGDIVGVHDYDQRPDALAERWGSSESVERQLSGR